MMALLGGEPAAAAEFAERFGLDPGERQRARGDGRLRVPRTARAARACSARGGDAAAHARRRLSLAGHGAAEEPLRAALAEVEWGAPVVPVISGYTAPPFRDFARELSRALVSPVRWREVMVVLAARGAREFIDVGPGRLLAKLVKRNAGGVEAHVVSA